MKVVVREDVSCLDPVAWSGMAAARAATKVAETCATEVLAAGRG